MASADQPFELTNASPMVAIRRERLSSCLREANGREVRLELGDFAGLEALPGGVAEAMVQFLDSPREL
jgi:hypothetical protein